MEVTDPTRLTNSNKIARLLSPMMISRTGRCISFYYFNTGNASSLHVYAAQNNTKTGKLDLSRRLFSGERDAASNQWRLGRVPLPTNLPTYQVCATAVAYSRF